METRISGTCGFEAPTRGASNVSSESLVGGKGRGRPPSRDDVSVPGGASRVGSTVDSVGSIGRDSPDRVSSLAGVVSGASGGGGESAGSRSADVAGSD
ncbi:MAG: hypothetical protein ACQEVA_01105 [Myxococcota bacterium]